MLRLRDIFKGRPRGREEILPVDAVDVSDPADDEALFLLIEELGGLGELRVPAAARQRGWAQVRTEVRARQARGAFAPVGARLRGVVHTRRLALGSTVALLAIALGVAGVLQLGRPDRGPNVADNSATTATTAVVDDSPTTLQPSSTTGGVPTTTKPVTPDTTAPSTSSTSGGSDSSPGTGTTHATARPPHTTATEPRTSTTQPASSTTQPASSTTQPASTTTTGEQLMTAEERERSATVAAAILAEAVKNGDTDAASSVLSNSASRGLVQMMATLHDVQSYKIVSVEASDTQFSKALVQFTDETADAQGQPLTVVRRFLFELHVDQSGALVIGIYAVPAE
jgi:hypothetical protein